MLFRNSHVFVFSAVMVGMVFFLSRRTVINLTPSFPVGLYWLNSDYSESDIVWFNVPADVERIVFDRHYIPTGAKLMKKISGVEGALWCVDNSSHSLNGTVFGRTRKNDSNGLPLPQLPDGCRTLKSDELIVTSENPLSFDSRYFGPIKKETVQGRLEELWIW